MCEKLHKKVTLTEFGIEIEISKKCKCSFTSPKYCSKKGNSNRFYYYTVKQLKDNFIQLGKYKYILNFTNLADAFHVRKTKISTRKLMTTLFTT